VYQSPRRHFDISRSLQVRNDFAQYRDLALAYSDADRTSPGRLKLWASGRVTELYQPRSKPGRPVEREILPPFEFLR
jgi:hypothetical protein